MDVVELVHLYQAKTDEEILQLAGQAEQLTTEARTVLAGEVTRRRLTSAERVTASTIPIEFLPADRGHDTTLAPLASQPTAAFIAEVLRSYHLHFWLFVRLMAPAVIVGTVAVLTGRHEVREIQRHVPRGMGLLQYRAEFFEMGLATWGGYLVSWIAFCFSFGAICCAVAQVGGGVVPAIGESFAAVRRKSGAVLCLSLLLFCLLFIALMLAMFTFAGAMEIFDRLHVRVSGFMITVLSFALMGLVSLLLSRFALALPAIVLDNYPVGKAMFRSDELTERKWAILAVLVFKSLLGGYVASMMPFWLARFLPVDISLPPWFPWLLTAASVSGVTLVEPIMFIGFAFLYLKTSARSSSSSQAQPVTV